MDDTNKDDLDNFGKDIKVQEIIVTTIDTVRYSYIQKFCILNEIPTLFVGPTGTGKSVYIQNVLMN
jgi:dynein heavy chain